MEFRKLDFGLTFQEAFTIGIKNIPSIIAAFLLWILTIWVPYFNIGTTIAIMLLPTELAKGSVIDPTAIFDSKYRRYMGEFFITAGLMMLPMFALCLFAFIPIISLTAGSGAMMDLSDLDFVDPMAFTGVIAVIMIVIYGVILPPAIVLSIAWSLAYYFLIAKGKNPIEAIKASNDATYGSKWIYFALALAMGILFGVVFGIVLGIFMLIDILALTIIMTVIVYLLFVAVGMGLSASIWKQLKDNVE